MMIVRLANYCHIRRRRRHRSNVVAPAPHPAYAARMDHAAHEPGTVAGCPECQAVAYEPGWYKALRDERILGRVPVKIPEADVDDGATVVLPDDEEIEVLLPDLEGARRDDDEGSLR